MKSWVKHIRHDMGRSDVVFRALFFSAYLLCASFFFRSSVWSTLCAQTASLLLLLYKGKGEEGEGLHHLKLIIDITYHVLNSPIKHVIVLEALTVEELLKESLQVGVVRAIFESQRTAIFEIGAELG